MRNFLLLFVCIVMLCTPASFAQIVGGNAFLQGHWLEIGEDNMGAFGTCSSPPGYHAHGGAVAGTATCFAAGAELDACYDWGHDGWGVGSPCEMGDYTIPGYPQEGWGMMYNGVEYRNWAGGGACTGPFNITGTITGYSNSGGQIISTWTGAAAGISVIQTTEVDTEASWVVVTAHIRNTSAATITGVYYERTCDPDNTSFWPGGTSATENVILHQNEDATHRVEIGTYGTTGIYNRYNSWMGLAAKDCRAKVFCLSSLYPTSNEATMWTAGPGVAGVTMTAYGDSNNADEGIALIFNIGSLAAAGTPGDSTAVSYAYEYNGPNGVDSAFPLPQLLVADSLLPVAAYGTPSYDTFDVCDHPGLDSLPVDILHGTSGNWTDSRWTWSPSTGLAATTGAINMIISDILPATITYTITGTDSSGPGVMLNCQTAVFYLTILACNQSTNNSPCAGDTLYLKLKGDSTGATYLWTGPDGFTSTLQDPFIYPAIAANTGEYYVYKTLLGVIDTDSTNVVIHPLPIVTVTSNAPLCTGAIDTLLLSVTPPSPGETFSWTGPDTFTSVLEFPSIDGFMPVNAGIYKVVVTTPFGCKDSGTVDAELIPPPPGPGISAIPAYCFGASFVPFVVSGTDVQWYPTAASTLGTPTPPVVNTRAPGTYTYYATQQIGSCLSPKDSVTVQVYTRIDPAFNPVITHGCSSDQVAFTNLTRNSNYYSWNWGDGSGITDSTSALIPHVHIYPVRDTYSVTITGYNAVCSGDTTIVIDTRHSVYSVFTPVPDTFCVNDTSVFYSGSYAIVYPTIFTGSGPDSGLVTSYLWNFGDGSPTVTSTTPDNQPHPYTVQGAYTVTLIVTDSISCQDTSRETVYALQIHIHSVNDTTLCLSQPLPLYNTITLVPDINLSDYNYVWTQSAPNLSDTSVHVPYLSGIGDFVDTLTVTLPGVVPNGCPARDTITIHSVLGAPVIDVTPNTTIRYGASIDLNASGEIDYRWLPNDGSLNNNSINNPIATPLVTTTYTVFGLDGNGCLDSAYVTITVDSTMHEGMPGGFTPNGDGLNDVWHPIGLQNQHLVEFRIFNRWGQQVFYSNDISKGWDGNFNGVPQDMGVYFYVVIVSTPEDPTNNITYKGNLTLLR